MQDKAKACKALIDEGEGAQFSRLTWLKQGIHQVIVLHKHIANAAFEIEDE